MNYHRAVLLALMLLGLAVGICGGLEQAPLGRAAFLAGERRKIDNLEPASQIKEVPQSLELCFNMTTDSTYLGVAIAIGAIVGLLFAKSRRRRTTLKIYVAKNIQRKMAFARHNGV